MELDERIDIRPYLDVDVEITYPLLDNGVPWQYVPHGWRLIVNTATGLCLLEQNAHIHRLTIKNGVLNIIFERAEYHSINRIMSWVEKGIAIESTKTCMVCGEGGKRRKTEVHFPTLCRKHYVQYVNFIEEQTS